jgi:glucosyl-dolichyl phosphate glucuronosyltransferase
MDATIIICTFNRSRLLDHTIAQLGRLEVSRGTEWEVLVVNNNCNDETDAVIRRHSEKLPIRGLWEPRPGKSHAANLAVKEAKGELLLWTDDDVLVDRAWLNAYVEAARSYPHASFFGGPITPRFEAEPPTWFSRHLHSIVNCYALRDAFDEPFVPISVDCLPYGANMATRAHCFHDCPFDVRLGPQRNTEIRGEELALLQKCHDRGLQGLWVQGARVQHFIPKSRLTERYIWDYHRGQGRTEVRLGQSAPAKEVFGMPRWVLRQYLENLALSKLWSLKKDDRWLRSLIRAAHCRGILKESWEQHVSGRAPSQLA